MIAVTGEKAAEGKPPASAPAFTAAQIRAMPESRYRALAHFLDAALSELGKVLRRLASRS